MSNSWVTEKYTIERNHEIHTVKEWYAHFLQVLILYNLGFFVTAMNQIYNVFQQKVIPDSSQDGEI